MSAFLPTLPPQIVLEMASLVAAVLLISVVALAVDRLSRHRSLPARHGVLLSALLLTATAPLLVLLAGRLGWGMVVPLAWEEPVEVEPVEQPAEPVAARETRIEKTPSPTESPVPPLTIGDLLQPGEVMQFRTTPERHAPIDHSPRIEEVAPAPAVAPVETSPLTRSVDWRPMVSAIGGWWIVIWSAGTLIAAFRLLSGWRQVGRLKATLQPINALPLVELLKQTAKTVGLKRVPGLMTSSQVPVPAVCGLWRPVVILPLEFVETHATSLAAILLHECAHIRRRDLWVGWLQRIVGALYWWNVPLWSVQRRLNDLREDLCDNHVLAHHADGRGYARVLLDLVSHASGTRPVPASVGLVEGPSSGLSARITRLLREDRNMATKLNRGSACLLALLALSTGVGICSLSLKTEPAAADDAAATPAVQPDAAGDETPTVGSSPATEAGPPSTPAPELYDQREILAPLYYDEQMLALVNAEGAAVVRFERQDNGSVRYEWRYLSAEDAALDPKIIPSPHELTGEGLLEPIMMGPMPYIDAGPLDLLWFPNTELQGWVSVRPDTMEVLAVKPSLFAEEKGPLDTTVEAIDLRSLLVSDDSNFSAADAPGPTSAVTSRVNYDAMVLVVSHPDGVAAFEFNDPFSEGNPQIQSRDGVRYRSYYRYDNGIDEAVGFGEVYEVFKELQYQQGQLQLEAGPVRVEWSQGDADGGWIYYDPRQVHCWLVSREYFEQFLPAGSRTTDRSFNLQQFRRGPRPFTPAVDTSQVADPAPVVVADDADAEQVRRQRIADAIDQGIEFLVAAQDEGHWTGESLSQHAVGVQSLALLGLLESGSPIDDPAVAKGLTWLREQADPEQTYDIALMMMALAAAGDEGDRERIAALAASLQQSQGEAGAWSYSGIAGGNWWDNSNSQFAVFGLYAAHLAEVEVDLAMVRAAADHYIQHQQGDVDSEVGAGWNYMGERGGTVSGNMTSSAIASLIMLSEILEAQPEISEADAARLAAADRAADAGLRWLDHHFSVRTNPGEQVWVLCYLMNLRRAAELSELTLIGEHDWYREGADFLVQGQNPNDGSWTGLAENDPVIATSMALLFLSAGQRDNLQAVIDDANAASIRRLQQELRRYEMGIFFLRENGIEPNEAQIQELQESIRAVQQQLLSQIESTAPMPSVEGPNTVATQQADPPGTPTVPTTNNSDPNQPPLPENPPIAGDVTVPGAPPASRSIVLLHLIAADDGSLGDVRFFNESLGGGAGAMETLITRLDEWKADLATRRELFELSAQVTADATLRYGDVISVIDACQQAGIDNVNLSTGPEGQVFEATLAYLRDAMGRKLSEEPILSIVNETGRASYASRHFGEAMPRNAGLSPTPFVLTLSVDPEVPADVVQQVIQAAAAFGFEKFTLKTLGGDAEPMASTIPGDASPAVANIIGEVIAFDEASQQVVFSIGFEDGIEQWKQYSIWRRKESEPGFDLIAICEVVVVLADQSSGRITVLNGERLPEPGDQVVAIEPQPPGESNGAARGAPPQTSPELLVQMWEQHRQMLKMLQASETELLERRPAIHPNVVEVQRQILMVEESLRNLEAEFAKWGLPIPVEPARGDSSATDPDVTSEFVPQTDEAELAALIERALGLKLTPVASDDARVVSHNLHGGLEVIGVLPDGPAASEGILPDDILIGLEHWETISLDNVAYVLSHPDVQESTLIKFYIVRDGETLFGYIEPAANDAVDGEFSSAEDLSGITSLARRLAAHSRGDNAAVGYVPFEALTVNLNEGRLNRFLQVEIRLQVPDAQVRTVVELVTAHRAALRNLMIGYLSELSTEDIRGEAGQERIRRQIRAQFNSVLWPEGEGQIQEVLFEQFTVQ
jgi:beta-lactamase regulating signal transducer with metallopeptidase domain/flagellar basal body-associated protein FliL/biopolymer transport protein ExbD